MTEIFYATDLLNRDKILPTSKQLQAVRPTLASCEDMIRDQARSDCQESIIKDYDAMVAKDYTGLPYVLLDIKYPNLLYQIDDHNQLVTPSSGSSNGDQMSRTLRQTKSRETTKQPSGFEPWTRGPSNRQATRPKIPFNPALPDWTPKPSSVEYEQLREPHFDTQA